MHKPVRIGITGGIGSGKSLVCKIFATLGIPVYDADTAARNLMQSDRMLIDQIKKEFGAMSYLNYTSLNREYLSQSVFNNPARLERLNKLVHPRVAADSERWMNENIKPPYIIKEAALLFESGSNQSLDKIIVVTAPELMRMNRVMKRDSSRTEEGIRKIISSQWPEEEKIKRADFIISNDESTLVIPQVLKLHERFIAFAGQ